MFSNERFTAARQEEGRYETQLFVYFLACKGLSNDDVGVARGTVFQEIRGRELVSQPAISSTKSWGGQDRRTSPAVFFLFGRLIFFVGLLGGDNGGVLLFVLLLPFSTRSTIDER